MDRLPMDRRRICHEIYLMPAPATSTAGIQVLARVAI